MKLFRQIIALLLACAFITGCAPKMEVGNKHLSLLSVNR